MTEPIKQEIINNIFENGDKLITGPILQTVLIDMIDDVNGKDQEILSKTGSWDNAVTQIPNLATKEEVTNLSESVARDIANVDVDLTGYATEQWVESQGYLKEHQDISNLATKTELNDTKNNLQGNITSLSESVARDIANVSVPEGVATEAWVQSQDYASKTYVNDAVSSSSVDLTGYATETWVQSQGYLTEHQDISGLATKTELNNTKDVIQSDMITLSGSMAKSIEDSAIAIVTEIQNKDYASKTYVNDAVAGINLSDYATKTELTSVSESVQTDITNLSESVASSTVWKKGTAQDSIVQKLTGNNEAKTSTATKTGAVAIGSQTTASGYYSHAEGGNTIASGWGSHAEGDSTVASGEYSHAEGNNSKALGNFGSHAEGGNTKASGIASHAEGSYTNASGSYSHAEGDSTNASGDSSHAEGRFTKAKGNYSHAEGVYSITSGSYSHAEGYSTRALNDYEHAQGTYNHNSTNQIFSVGAGEYANGTETRRNAVSILAVPNADTKINTASVFVQNVGGYDGTNPTPGTNDLATVINGMSTGGGSSETLWKKGTGQNSLVQVWTGDYEAFTPTATSLGAVAIGVQTKASGVGSHAEGSGTLTSGMYSHAEGNDTTASGDYSHAEGYRTTTSGSYSHAEGYWTEAKGNYSHAEGGYTTTSNQYEHAQGQYNYTSSNQIFSVGAGESINYETTRRNAISVLAVPNSETQVLTASFFVQNIGGYDGTNPIPGTNDLATVINNLPSGGGSSSGGSSGGGSSETLWKKGTGTDSIVQIIADGTEQPNATGERAIAEGQGTKAEGLASHAEGRGTKASGIGSHAEGFWTEAPGHDSHAEGGNTKASGEYSHAEGWYAFATNQYEHAQGTYNHNSTNQIFSVGAGEMAPDYSINRRNALSVLVVPNADTKINTASFFVQNVGGYDGTNPLPGTNDLATVLNNTETWTFTLDDGSTVTKAIIIA